MSKLKLRAGIKNLSPGQYEFLTTKVFPGKDLEALPAKQTKSLISLLERTHQKNQENQVKIKELLTQFADKQEEFNTKFTIPEILDEEYFDEMKSFLTFVPAPVVIEPLPITHGFLKTPIEDRVPGLNSYESEKDAIQTIKDNSVDLFECGQGYGQGYGQEEAEEYCYIDGVFFKATIKAALDSQKMDRGDRLYWVDFIEDVTFEIAQESALKELEKKAKQDELKKAKLLVTKLEAELALL